jgi:hypothetical protein
MTTFFLTPYYLIHALFGFFKIKEVLLLLANRCVALSIGPATRRENNSQKAVINKLYSALILLK